MKINHFVYISLSVALLLASCTAQKKVAYLKNADRITEAQLQNNSAIFEAKIMPKDVLTIAVNTITPEVAAPFNLGSSAGSGVTTSIGLQGAELQTYVVDAAGNINYPVVGTLHVAGLGRVQLQELIRTSIYPKYITEEPIVNVRFKNYKVSVLGEVAKPGQYTVQNEQCTIFEALAMAGDMTIYGNRNNVMLIREDATGAKRMRRIDLQDDSVLTDPTIFYLQQNDVLYIEPNKAKSRQAGLGSAETYSLSALSVLLSVISIILSFKK
ncbi:MAG: polysaccharide biosynthesis/export family protein [Rikenellaceae bacterium]|jgi:polysaccharide export outer membrane protein|nr:polysaccharide biosynthesis/export family protein [Rikenellaceae bacterium]